VDGLVVDWGVFRLGLMFRPGLVVLHHPHPVLIEIGRLGVGAVR
jgi:hypothetical protein